MDHLDNGKRLYKYHLPEVGPNQAANRIDRAIIRLMLLKRWAGGGTLGDFIGTRGIDPHYIIDLAGRYPLRPIIEYVESLKAVGSQSYERILSSRFDNRNRWDKVWIDLDRDISEW